MLGIGRLLDHHAGGAANDRRAAEKQQAEELAGKLEKTVEHISDNGHAYHMKAYAINDDFFKANHDFPQCGDPEFYAHLEMLRHKSKLYALRDRLIGPGGPDWNAANCYAPKKDGLIDRLRTGETGYTQAQKELQAIAHGRFSAFGAEAFEGVPRNAKVGYLRKIWGNEQFERIFHPVEAMTKAAADTKITIGKDKEGKAVSTPDAVRELIVNGDKLPAGVTAEYIPGSGAMNRLRELWNRLSGGNR